MDAHQHSMAAARRKKLAQQRNLVFKRQLLRRQTSGQSEESESFSFSTHNNADSSVKNMETNNAKEIKSFEDSFIKQMESLSSFKDSSAATELESQHSVFDKDSESVAPKRPVLFKTSPKSNRNLNRFREEKHEDAETFSTWQEEKVPEPEPEPFVKPVIVQPMHRRVDDLKIISKPKSQTRLQHVEQKTDPPVPRPKNIIPPKIKTMQPTIQQESTNKSDDEKVFKPKLKRKRKKKKKKKEITDPLLKMCEKDLTGFLLNALPKNVGISQCYIERNKIGATKRLFPEYHLFLKSDDRFILAGKKRSKKRTSNYVISMDQTDMHRNSPSCLGKLRANFLGTEFQMFDSGNRPSNKKGDNKENESDDDDEDDGAESVNSTKTESRKELCALTYASNILGSRGPRKMRVGVPAVDEDGLILTENDQKNCVLKRLKKQNCGDDIMELVNKPPRWNDQVGAYVLNFSGRVTMASVKNFQLVLADDEDQVVLQFGRVGKDLFTMDFSWPLSPIQAFSICLSSFDSKLACE